MNSVDYRLTCVGHRHSFSRGWPTSRLVWIDSFQYFGGSLAGFFLGRLLDKSWDYYFYFMVPFGIIGGILMCTLLGKVTSKAGH